MIPLVTIGEESGYVFEGLIRGSYAFVPEGCVEFDDNGAATVDEIAYVQSGWDVRNMRFNNQDAAGSRLFPSLRGVIADLGGRPVASFVERIQAAYLHH